MKKLKVVISVDRQNTRYKVPITFTLVPPVGPDYYGNGHHMDVHLPCYDQLVDVRNAGTVDLEKLARIWLTAFYGDGLKDVRVLEREGA